MSKPCAYPTRVALCDLFTLYHQCNRDATLSSKFVKSCVRTIGNEAMINDVKPMLPILIEWFIELDGNNEISSLEVRFLKRKH
jgi:hypothetical protein